MLGEAATGAGAVGIAFAAYALVSEPNGVWKVRSSAAELVMLILFFAAFTSVCYDAAGKRDPLIGSIIIFLTGGLLPAAVNFLGDFSKPVMMKDGVMKQTSWVMSDLARVGLVAATMCTLGVEIGWYERKTTIVSDATGTVAAGVMLLFAVAISIYGMPAATDDVAQVAQNSATPQKKGNRPNKKFIF